MDSKILLILSLSAAVGLALFAGSYGLERQLESLKSEYAALEHEHKALVKEMGQLMEQKRLLSAGLDDLEKYSPAAPLNRLELYSGLQRAAKESSIEVLSTRWDGDLLPQQRASVVIMVLRGDYYDMMRLLAAWRTLPVSCRIAGLMIRPGVAENAQGTIEAEVTLEALLSTL